MSSNEPAFPRPASIGNDYLTGEEGVVVDPQQGMTLRDYFAAKAMAARAGAHYGKWDDLAHEAYAIADAMLRERAEEGK